MSVRFNRKLASEKKRSWGKEAADASREGCYVQQAWALVGVEDLGEGFRALRDLADGEVDEAEARKRVAAAKGARRGGGQDAAFEAYAFAFMLRKVGSNDLLKVLHWLLLERSLIVVGSMASDVGFAVVALLDALSPYTWQGAAVPVLPKGLEGVMESPVPFVVGVVGGGEAVSRARAEGVAVLNLDRGGLEGGSEDAEGLASGVAGVLGAAEITVRGYADRGGALGDMWKFIRGEAEEGEKRCVQRARDVVQEHMRSFAGDIGKGQNGWQKYGMLNRETAEFEFYPGWFVEPLRAVVDYTSKIVETQMFVSFVEERRKGDLRRKEGAGRVAAFLARWIWFRLIAKGKLGNRGTDKDNGDDEKAGGKEGEA